MDYPYPIERLINSYMTLPGIGQKTATRLAFYTLNMNDELVKNFANSLLRVKKDLKFCQICGNITIDLLCEICSDKSRDCSTILVVEQVKDLIVLEKIQNYKGLYHVLNGVISPICGTGPEDINLISLFHRLKKNEIKEVIIATNANIEGEATAMYISQILKSAKIKVTRLAYGLSVGTDIEYADANTLLKAVEGRTEL